MFLSFLVEFAPTAVNELELGFIQVAINFEQGMDLCLFV